MITSFFPSLATEAKNITNRKHKLGSVATSEQTSTFKKPKHETNPTISVDDIDALTCFAAPLALSSSSSSAASASTLSCSIVSESSQSSSLTIIDLEDEEKSKQTLLPLPDLSDFTLSNTKSPAKRTRKASKTGKASTPKKKNVTNDSTEPQIKPSISQVITQPVRLFAPGSEEDKKHQAYQVKPIPPDPILSEPIFDIRLHEEIRNAALRWPQQKQLVLSGGSGQGKTFLCQRVAAELGWGYQEIDLDTIESDYHESVLISGLNNKTAKRKPIMTVLSGYDFSDSQIVSKLKSVLTLMWEVQTAETRTKKAKLERSRNGPIMYCNFVIIHIHPSRRITSWVKFLLNTAKAPILYMTPLSTTKRIQALQTFGLSANDSRAHPTDLRQFQFLAQYPQFHSYKPESLLYEQLQLIFRPSPSTLTSKATLVQCDDLDDTSTPTNEDDGIPSEDIPIDNEEETISGSYKLIDHLYKNMLNFTPEADMEIKNMGISSQFSDSDLLCSSRHGLTDHALSILQLQIKTEQRYWLENKIKSTTWKVEMIPFFHCQSKSDRCSSRQLDTMTWSRMMLHTEQEIRREKDHTHEITTDLNTAWQSIMIPGVFDDTRTLDIAKRALPESQFGHLWSCPREYFHHFKLEDTPQ